MEKESSGRLQELSNMQLKISYLFKDIMREKNDFKENSENLNKKLEKIYDETENIKNEAESLKKENKALRLINEDMRNIIERGIKIFKNLDFSQENLNKKEKIALETLKTIFLECSTKFEISDEIIKERKKNNEIWQADEIKKEIEGLSHLNFCTEFFCDEEPNKNSPKKDWGLKKTNSDAVLKTVCQNTNEGMKKPKESSSNCENETFQSEFMNVKINTNIFSPSELSPEILEAECNLTKSPVFKDFAVQRHESLSSEESSNTSSTSLCTKLINEKIFERSNDFILSPWKKSPHQRKEKSPSTPKRVKRKLKINSPERSPLLKKSNTREAEISFSGVRKLRQTFLNVECYKKKSLENRENEHFNWKDEDKTNMEEDDIITESPKKADRMLEEIRNKKSGKELNDFLPPQPSGPDLDETYVSSSLIRKCNLKKKHELEVIEDQTPLKRPAREKSPEYDSVPFVYKREPVRKKTERMKLPGHACMECNKYYENAFDDIGTQDLKKILNKCSRHRDKNSPTLDDTPPGYWKPFLTCSTTISPNKNDISKNSHY